MTYPYNQHSNPAPMDDAASTTSSCSSASTSMGVKHWISKCSLRSSPSPSPSPSEPADPQRSQPLPRLSRHKTKSHPSLRSCVSSLELMITRRFAPTRCNSPVSWKADTGYHSTTGSTASGSGAFDDGDNSGLDGPFTARIAATALLDPQLAAHANTLHHVFKYQLGRIYFAAIDDAFMSEARRILHMDGGVGGEWPTEMAKMFPSADVQAISERRFDPQSLLSGEVSPTSAEPLPHNYHIMRRALSDDMTCSGQPYDYVHRSFLHPLVADAQWPQAIRNLFRASRPGAHVELAELDITFSNPPVHPQADYALVTGMLDSLRGNRDGQQVPLRRLSPLLTAAGFIEQHFEAHTVPCGAWGELSGRLLEGVLRDMLAMMQDTADNNAMPRDAAAFREFGTVLLKHLNQWKAQFRLSVYTARVPMCDDIACSAYPSV